MIEKGGFVTQHHDCIAAVYVDSENGLNALDADRRRAAEEGLHRLRAGNVDQLNVEIVFGEESFVHGNPRYNGGS